MTPFEIYTLVISLLVITSLVAFLALIIWYVYILTMRLIYLGYWDQELVQEYAFKTRITPASRVGKIISMVVCGIVAVIMLFTIFLGITENATTYGIPSLKVVKSGSMSEKHEDNEYLINHNLNDQIQTFDVITVHSAPKEEDIKLYDIIVYEKNGDLVIHRVVYIEEVNEIHPDGRRFYTRGDANKTNDANPVKYDQIRGIYRGERVPFIGSFILFMQSPAGIICLLLAIAAMVIMPIVDDKIDEARSHRYRRLQTGFATARKYYNTKN